MLLPHQKVRSITDHQGLGHHHVNVSLMISDFIVLERFRAASKSLKDWLGYPLSTFLGQKVFSSAEWLKTLSSAASTGPSLVTASSDAKKDSRDQDPEAMRVEHSLASSAAWHFDFKLLICAESSSWTVLQGAGCDHGNELTHERKSSCDHCFSDPKHLGKWSFNAMSTIVNPE